jgi:hypothetical protein
LIIFLAISKLIFIFVSVQQIAHDAHYC